MWNWFVRELIVASGLVLLVAGSYCQGRLIGRWEPLPNAPVVDLAAIPAELDAWTAGDDLTLEPEQLETAGVDRYLARTYEHEETGEVLSVLVLSGPGGPISVHPPDVCFAGRGYQAESVITPVRVSTPLGGDHRFAMTIFRSPPSEGDQRVQLFWAWSRDGNWSTPSNPRLTFARYPRVYKLYVSRFLRPEQGRQDVDDCLAFMNQLLPELQKLLAEPSTLRDAALESDKTSASFHFVRPQPAQDVVPEREAGRFPSLAGRDGEIRR